MKNVNHLKSAKDAFAYQCGDVIKIIYKREQDIQKPHAIAIYDSGKIGLCPRSTYRQSVAASGGEGVIPG